MSSPSVSASEFPATRASRARRTFPRLALRRRSADHPMVMFAIVICCAFASMAFVPTNGPAFASFSAPMKLNEDIRTTAKLARMPVTEADIVCRGQSWTAESDTCLQLIAQASGSEGTRKVRRLAQATRLDTTPNIF